MTTGAIAGTRKSLPTPVTWCSCRIRAAQPAMASNSSPTFPATGQPAGYSSCTKGDISNQRCTMAARLHLCRLRERIGAAGLPVTAGIRIDWDEGRNNDPRFQFKVLVSHDGVYNLTSYDRRYRGTMVCRLGIQGHALETRPECTVASGRHNVSCKNSKTPILIITNELDYRVPVTEGLQMFTAVQRMGIESKLMVFPDEGHWVGKPANAHFWYTTVLSWLDKHLK